MLHIGITTRRMAICWFLFIFLTAQRLEVRSAVNLQTNLQQVLVNTLQVFIHVIVTKLRIPFRRNFHPVVDISTHRADGTTGIVTLFRLLTYTAQSAVAISETDVIRREFLRMRGMIVTADYLIIQDKIVLMQMRHVNIMGVVALVVHIIHVSRTGDVGKADGSESNISREQKVPHVSKMASLHRVLPWPAKFKYLWCIINTVEIYRSVAYSLIMPL